MCSQSDGLGIHMCTATGRELASEPRPGELNLSHGLHCFSANYSTRHTFVSCFPYQPTRLDPRSHAHALAHTHTCTHAYMHTHVLVCMPHAHAHIQKHTHIHMHTYTCTHTQSPAHRHVAYTWGVPFVSSAVNSHARFWIEAMRTDGN